MCQQNAAKLTGRCLTVKTAKVTQDVLKGKKETEYSLKALSIMRSQPNRTDFQLLKTKLKAKKTPKQAETEGGCSEGP